MYKGKTVGVVVTAYNEEGLVGDVIDDIPGFVDSVYVIDDCSTDGTWNEILDRIEDPMETDMERTQTALADGGEVSGRVIAVRHQENQGVGGAIKTGYKLAREQERDVTAVINGDGQMDPTILDRFIDPIVEGEADYAKGNRIQSMELCAEMPRWRLFGNVILTLLTKIASGYQKTNDSQNGYTAVSLDVLETIDIDELYDRFGFLNDFLITLNCYDFRIIDVPMKAKYGEERSSIRYRTFVPRLSALLLRGFLWRLKVKYFVLDFHPLVFLYIFGSVGIAASIGLGSLAVLQGASITATVTVLLLLLFSACLCVSAMTLDMHHNQGLESRASY